MSNSKIAKNSICPNGIQKDEDGYTIFYPIGTNKVDIPKNSPYWPKGSKLVGTFVYDKNDKLVGFCDTKAMISENNGEIVVMPYEHIDTEFDSIEKDSIQIHAPKATYKKASWTDGKKIDIPDVQYKYKGCKNVTQIQSVDVNYLENDIKDGKWTELLSDVTAGGNVFRENANITSFTSDLSSLRDGSYMFTGSKNLSSFNCDLSSLTYGAVMFDGCSNLTSFASDLSSLTDGSYMFRGCSNITIFDHELKNLNNGDFMFSGCSNLVSFVSNLGSISSAWYMFDGCSNLVSFKGDLSSLVNGDTMFNGCFKLSAIDCNNLSSLTKGAYMFGRCKLLSTFEYDLSPLTIGYYMFSDCSNLTSFKSNLNSLINGTGMFHVCKLNAPSIKNIIDTINTVDSGELTLGIGCDNNQIDINLFAQEVGYPDMTTLLSALQNKGWTVTVQYNGRPSTTFSLRKPESLPVYTKLVEVIPSEEDYTHYEYTSQDGSKFYNLDWFHETTGSTEGYDVFSSLEEAITTFNIKPIEK